MATVPDIDLFIETHVVKDAQTSSKIEGTRTGNDEAVTTAIAELKTLPLSNRLRKETHAILMQGIRGEHKQPRGAPPQPELDRRLDGLKPSGSPSRAVAMGTAASGSAAAVDSARSSD